ncbi:hypothetical protein F5X71_10530 [Nocardia brasiliensis]|uniref:Uncharacterized protein n=1 Tax=Nocardia brasiliensis TaxID=37326 RepID=A0A6G9XP69_NOCBR|nr:hypothetical protein [Nocardia brasiliensis]QIS02699.1 hypothetical protein F5X71_10530 [Nocardia brasiliensis]
MTVIPTHDDADHAEQLVSAYPDPAEELDLDAAALAPLAESARAALDSADIADRYEQSVLTPIPDDDYPLAY